MSQFGSWSRREIMAGSGLWMAGAFGGVSVQAAASAPAEAKPPPSAECKPAPKSDLAIHGGPKTVSKGVPGLGRRWGDPERQQLEEMFHRTPCFTGAAQEPDWSKNGSAKAAR